MYSYIKGLLVHKENSLLVVEVNGIGYSLFVPLSTLERAGEVGKDIKVYTCMYIREDTAVLYGFLSLEEKKIFQQLITVSGVGPKAALSVISNVPVSKFALAVITDDIAAFTKAPGIGRKTAQRIILELKDKLKKEQSNTSDARLEVDKTAKEENSKKIEAVDALMMLGYSRREAFEAVLAVYDENERLEEILKKALKRVANSR